MGEQDLPSPPPEAALIRIARQARGLTVAEAAAEAGIIKASRWGQIENGYLMKSGSPVPTSAGDMQLAHMARVVGVAADELESAGREDAAVILRRMTQSGRGSSERGDDLEERIARIRANPAARARLLDLLVAARLPEAEEEDEQQRHSDAG